MIFNIKSIIFLWLYNVAFNELHFKECMPLQLEKLHITLSQISGIEKYITTFPILYYESDYKML